MGSSLVSWGSSKETGRIPPSRSACSGPAMLGGTSEVLGELEIKEAEWLSNLAREVKGKCPDQARVSHHPALTWSLRTEMRCFPCCLLELPIGSTFYTFHILQLSISKTYGAPASWWPPSCCLCEERGCQAVPSLPSGAHIPGRSCEAPGCLSSLPSPMPSWQKPPHENSPATGGEAEENISTTKFNAPRRAKSSFSLWSYWGQKAWGRRGALGPFVLFRINTVTLCYADVNSNKHQGFPGSGL
jgi:hypothetical protein